ncbi:signal peptidase I SipW [Ornithinibacillus halotolerans]|uniref:Signal peptidase I n=1 Tax=Ornithinibacillus halotolerans TaxID=1274357 RepID=A0A916RS61_9BACI|nr:signal peptidase I [Ornithinibacillus halotolerans]GGA67066.1 S26 family signal peptidase [Ornithinibacillus halotolerans]
MKKPITKKILSFLNHATTVVLFLVLISMTVMVVSTKASGGEPEIFGHQLKTVLSGSMEPGIKTGSIIAVKPGGDMTRFKPGDVITFQEEDGKIITHRITEVLESGENTMYRTKGDNNNAEDINPVLSENVLAEYTGFTIPYAGYFISFAQSQNGALLLLIPGFLLIGYAGITIWRAIRELEVPSKENKEEEKNTSLT